MAHALGQPDAVVPVVNGIQEEIYHLLDMVAALAVVPEHPVLIGQHLVYALGGDVPHLVARELYPL